MTQQAVMTGLKTPTSEQASEPGAVRASIHEGVFRIGELLPDGWIVGPASPRTGIVMLIESPSTVIKLAYKWHRKLSDEYFSWLLGEKHAEELRQQGHANARQPSVRELYAIYNDVVIAGRNSHAQYSTGRGSRVYIRGDYSWGKYWSGELERGGERAIHMNFGASAQQASDSKDDHLRAYVRCVRDAPGIRLG